MKPLHLAAAAALLLGATLTTAKADPIPPGGVGQNVEAIGYSDLNGKPGFKMSIQKVGERWYLYIGMLWNEGWHIVDVTDPKDPKVVKEIQGPANTATDQMEIADGKVSGNTISWTMDMKVPMPMTLEGEATVDGDSITGAVKAGAFGSMALSGSRAS